MNRVLLVYEDMKLLSHTEMVLKKISFDVLGIGNELSLKENLIGFNPDVVIVFGSSSKVNSMSTGRRIADITSFKGKVILCISPNNKPTASEIKGVKLDMILEAPITDEKIIEAVTKILGLPAEVYFEKYARILTPNSNKGIKSNSGAGAQSEQNSTATAISTSNAASTAASLSKREERNKKFLTDPNFKAGDRIKPQEAKKIWRTLESEWDQKELEKLDLLKKDFVRALFKKKS